MTRAWLLLLLAVQATPADLTITYSIPCSALEARARSEICSRTARFPDTTLTPATRRHLLDGFAHPLTLTIWSPNDSSAASATRCATPHPRRRP
jgi:hypothetical protein